MKKLLLLLLALTLVFAFAACAQEDPAPVDEETVGDGTEVAGEAEGGDTEAETDGEAVEDDLAYVQEKGNLVIGITIFEPMNYYDENGELIGFDTEFAQAVCAELGLTPEFIVINWDTKEIELQSKEIDCIWNGMTIDDDRRENMLFSQPYIRNMQVAVIRTEDAATYTDTASLSGATLVAEVSSAGENAILADENLSQATYVPVSKQTDALLEVKAGTAQAAVLDYVLADAMVGEGTDYSDLMMIEGVELAVEEYGIGFRLGSNLAAEVDAVIDQLAADGTLNEIAVKYGLEGQLIFNQQ